MEKKQNKWELKSYTQALADTGDYSTSYKLTNGEIILVTHDEIDCEWNGYDCETVLEDIMNHIGARWYSPKEEEYKIDKELAQSSCKEWKETANILYRELMYIMATRIPAEKMPINALKALELYESMNTMLPG